MATNSQSFTLRMELLNEDENPEDSVHNGFSKMGLNMVMRFKSVCFLTGKTPISIKD